MAGVLNRGKRALGVTFVSKKFTLLPITMGICRSEIWGVNFTFEICQGLNERLKVENP